MPTSQPSEPDWEEIIIQLQAFTRSFVKGKGWFRGKNASTLLKGQEIDDYVYEAIGRYLANPEKYRSEDGNLVDYLKWNLIRSLVSNDLVSAENRTSSDSLNNMRKADESEDFLYYRDARLPYLSVLFDERVDYNSIINYIQEEVSYDQRVEEVFLGRSEELMRREIIKEFNMSETEYNNAVRRLETILKKVKQRFDIQNLIK
jgi:hypothetical protein